MHDCYLKGILTLKSGVTEASLRETFSGFLKKIDSKFDEEVNKGNIEFDGGDMLYLSLEFYGRGGYRDEDLDALAERLGGIVAGPGYLEILDFDSGCADSVRTPLFVAPDKNGLRLARVRYGLDQMMDYVTPVIGEKAVTAIRELALDLAGKASDRAKLEAARKFMRELEDSVETLGGIADAYGAHTLADLMWLQHAILDDGYITYIPEHSCVLDVVRPLPSGPLWVKYIQVA
jgi:hypothetical protein